MIEICTIEDIEVLSESVDLECKLAAGKDGKGELPADFWPTYSAFANTHGGIVLLGIKQKNDRFSLHGVAEPERIVIAPFGTDPNGASLRHLYICNHNKKADEWPSYIKIDIVHNGIKLLKLAAFSGQTLFL